MIHGLTEYEKFKVIRPVLGNHPLDKEKLPIMHKVTEDEIDLENAIPTNIKNLSKRYNNSDKIVLSFNYDKDILKYWTDPLKYLPVLQTAMAISTPDYSVYPTMNVNEIRHNVYMGRWLGCLWQDYGVIAIPTIQWSYSDTYDICFGGIEPGGIVIISTIGCSEHLTVFYEGYNEMLNRLSPSLVLVYGDIMPEMYGRFIHYKYNEAFNYNKITYKQLSLFESSRIFERKRGA